VVLVNGVSARIYVDTYLVRLGGRDVSAIVALLMVGRGVSVIVALLTVVVAMLCSRVMRE